MNTKKIILGVVWLIVWVLLVMWCIYATKLIIKDIQVTKANNKIEKAKEEYAECVVIMKESHADAEEARERIKEITGTWDFTKESDEAQTKKTSTLTWLSKTSN